MKNILKISLAMILLFTISCETTELEIVDNPNASTVDGLNADLLLNNIQVDFASFFEEATEAGGEATRLEYMFDEYAVNYISTNPSNANMWTIGYANIAKDVEALLNISEAEDFHVHSGIAKTLRAYVFMSLVDYFGDIPYSEALQAESGILFPSVDSGQEVYAGALADLDAALVDFANASEAVAQPSNDLFYEGNTSKWVKFVNSLKLKYYLNLRLVDQAGAQQGINALLSEGNLMDSNADNFVFRYSSSTSPISKHPYYLEEYDAASTGEYMTNYLMWSLVEEKGIVDPRTRYYFYRQVNSFPDDEETLNEVLDCWNDTRPAYFDVIDSGLPFCSLLENGQGYWGRDHGNAQGIPPDNAQRTTFGVYPVGGKFDDNNATPIDSGDGLDGAGIWPIMTSSSVYFMRSEAALFLATSDDPKVMLEEGVRKSIGQVMSFLPDPSAYSNVPSVENVDAYVSFVTDAYDATASNADKMAIIGKEYYISLFGNGVEAYNLYRRTGTPINLQPTLLNLGNFPRSMYYPAGEVDSNPNISQKSGLDQQVFWDNNPAGFIQ